MTTPAITLEVLPAAYGDCLLVSCPVGSATWRLLVDTGPGDTYPALKARLAKLPLNGHGKRRIDLAIISHIDHDHIGGAGLVLDDDALNLSFGDIWFNARPQLATRGVAEGESLAGLLGAKDLKLPWNLAFAGKAAVTAADGAFAELPTRAGRPRITLLSPSPRRLADLFKVWDKALAQLRSKESDKAVELEPTPRGAEVLDIASLAAKSTPTDHSVANGSSIAMLLEHMGASVLLGADAVPTVMVPALKALAAKRKLPDGLHVNAIKLSHHGSRANVTSDLLKAVRAEHYVFSTNNTNFNHPDDEAVARVLVNGGKGPTLWFNYATPRNLRWADAQLQARHDFRAQYPAAGSSGVVITLPARPAR